MRDPKTSGERDEVQTIVYAISHDLREPARVVQSFTELLVERLGSDLDERALRYVGHIKSATQRMQHQIEGLLDYSRIASRFSVEPEICLTEVADRARASLAKRTHELRGAIEIGPLPTVAGDRRALKALFQILFDNALRFTVEAPKISVSTRQSDRGRDRIEITDNGIGIARDDQERVFDLFSRVHGGEFEGSGAGLAIARRIIDCHGGEIGVESTPGAGSSFWFEVGAT